MGVGWVGFTTRGQQLIQPGWTRSLSLSLSLYSLSLSLSLYPLSISLSLSLLSLSLSLPLSLSVSLCLSLSVPPSPSLPPLLLYSNPLLWTDRSSDSTLLLRDDGNLFTCHVSWFEVP